MPRFVTHYQLSKLVNFRLRQENLKEVTSQQVYGALRNKPAFDLDDPATLRWIEKYVESRRSGRTLGASIDPEEFFAEVEAAKAAKAAEAVQTESDELEG